MIVELDAFSDLGLIIKAPTGVRYSNQSGGFACEHPETEGFFVPLRTRAGRSELTTLAGIFRGAWNRLDDAQADAVDRASRRHGIGSIRVDRSMLSESREAWVHVIISAHDKDFVPLADASGEAKGVLVWPNSDWSAESHRHLTRTRTRTDTAGTKQIPSAI